MVLEIAPLDQRAAACGAGRIGVLIHNAGHMISDLLKPAVLS